MKTQIIIIHGGDVFETYDAYIEYLKNYEIESVEYFKRKDWKDSLGMLLGSDVETIAPRMPNPRNARYEEWKIWFEKLFPFINDGVMFICHSLGGIFLAKYLSENNFPKKITASFLIAPPFDAQGSEYSLGDFTLPADLTEFQAQGGKIYLYYSTDDSVVPFANLAKYKKELPEATEKVFTDRGHFNQAEFPEFVAEIKKLVK